MGKNALRQVLPLSLSPEHRADLEKSGLSPAMIEDCCFRSVPPDQIKKILGWDAAVVSMMEIPYPGNDGFTRYKFFPPLTDKNGKDQKYFQMKGTGAALYRPPGFDEKSAIRRVTEGEKKAAKATQEGLNTCGLGGIWNFGIKDGSGQTSLIEDLEEMVWEGVTAEIVPDADFRTKEHVAHAVYRFGTLLEHRGAMVKIVCLPGVMKLDDYLVRHRAEDFLKLPRITLDDPFFRRSIVKERGLIHAIGQSVVSLRSLLEKKIEPRPYYLWPWLRAGVLAMIYSARGVGKTFLCLILALAITRQLRVGGWRTDKCAGVLYFDGEMAVDDDQERLRHLSRDLPPELAPFHILSSAAMQGDGWPTPNLADEKWREAVSQFLVECEVYQVLILDNIAALAPGLSENEKEAWDEINQWLLSLRFMGLAVILVHHAGKSGDQRGTSGREDALDVSIKLTRPAGYKNEDGCCFDVEFTKARGVLGEGAAPFSVKVFPDNHGGLKWTTDDVGSSSREKIVALLGNGTPQKDIPTLLKCDKGWVSRVKAKAVNDGYLTKSGEFTPEGRIHYEGVDIDELLS
jgi:hypothetical protein